MTSAELRTLTRLLSPNQQERCTRYVEAVRGLVGTMSEQEEREARIAHASDRAVGECIYDIFATRWAAELKRSA